jgi:hypothetical protein
MQFQKLLFAVAASMAVAAPAPDVAAANVGLAPRQCLPASCVSFGVSCHSLPKIS